jgi:hypothetical protein
MNAIFAALDKGTHPHSGRFDRLNDRRLQDVMWGAALI